jgi:hypothetical protein
LADDEPRQRSGRTGEERGQGPAANDGYGELSDEFDDFIDDGDRGNWARRKQRARTNAVAARSGLDPQALQVWFALSKGAGILLWQCVMSQHAAGGMQLGHFGLLVQVLAYRCAHSNALLSVLKLHYSHPHTVPAGRRPLVNLH